jgi:hypothetical protein
MNPNLENRIWNMIEAVNNLNDAPPGDPRHASALDDVLDACYELLLATEAEGAGSAVATPVPATASQAALTLGERIARLISEGRGIRETARLLGVNPSTVSRSVRQAKERARQAHDAGTKAIESTG